MKYTLTILSTAILAGCGGHQLIEAERTEPPCIVPPAYISRYAIREERSVEELLRRACPRVERMRQAGMDFPIFLVTPQRQERVTYAFLLTLHPSTVRLIRVTDAVYIEIDERGRRLPRSP